MQKTTFLLILIAALGIGSVLYLMGGSGDVQADSDPITYSIPRKSYTPFEQHVEEGLKQAQSLTDLLNELESLRERKNTMDAAVVSFDNHAQQYLQSAESEAAMIQDSSLRKLVMHQLDLERDSLEIRTISLRQEQKKMTDVAQKAEDLGRSMRILASTGPFSKWTKENHPATADLELLTRDFQKLLDEFKAGAAAI